MRRTLQALACAALVIACAVYVSAQSKPCTRLAVKGRSGDVFNRLSANQMNWWMKDGEKKYKNICLVSKVDDADYVLVWIEQWNDYAEQIVVPKTSTTRHTGTVNATSTNGSSTVNTTGTYSGTSTTTTYENETFEYSVQRVHARLYKIEGPEGQREVNEIPVLLSNHKGQMRWSKPDKDVLVDALKFIAKQ